MANYIIFNAVGTRQRGLVGYQFDRASIETLPALSFCTCQIKTMN